MNHVSTKNEITIAKKCKEVGAMKNGWQKTKFKNFLTLQRGFDLPRSDMTEGHYPVLGSTSVIGYHNEFKVNPPGVVTGRSGSLGVIQFIDKPYWPHNTALWVKDFKGNNPRFVYFFLQTLDLKSFNAGVGVPTLNRNHLDNLQLLVPSIDCQTRIASILSAYDDLIENNMRRIKILEEMARWIYHEWFVEWNIPVETRFNASKNGGGNETRNIGETRNINETRSNRVSTENTIQLRKATPEEKKVTGKDVFPKEWEIHRVEDLVRRIPSGKKYENKTANKIGTIPIIDQGRSGVIGYHDDEPGVIASLDTPVIVFTNHTCYQRFIQFPFSAIQNVLSFIPTDDRILNRNIYWLHWATIGIISFNDYKGHWPEFMKKLIVVPRKEDSDDFGIKIKPIAQTICILERQNTNLRQTRDLLLPKLICGEVEV